MSSLEREPTGLEIAIIGMACHFPGARSPEELWENLVAGRESIAFFTDEELRASGIPPGILAHPGLVKAGAPIEAYDEFDADFFGIPPLEAELLDPQQRLFLERSWEALERAGYDPRQFSGTIGVYAGLNKSSYLDHVLTPRRARAEASGLQILLATDRDFLASRTAYKLDLEGPAVVIQTACSTSLVAVHVACQGLLAGECDMALAGGANVRVPQKMGYFYEEEGILSRDGHCRPFDAAATGTVPGSGVGVVVLKRLADAIADRDPIEAVILGSAVNNDGARKLGYAAPRVEGQAKVIRAAMAAAGVSPEDVTAVEAHGTATLLGDPVEVQALHQAFAGVREKRSRALGSIKSNFGHLDAAAGVAGLMKLALSLKHKTHPRSLHFERPNPAIDFDAGPFAVTTETTPWLSDGRPRLGGVSSFGIGGTNAHAILEEAPELPRASAAAERELIVLSARSEEALERAGANLASFFESRPETNLGDAAHTLRVGRRAFSWRRSLVCSSAKDAAAKLAAPFSPVPVPEAPREVAFLFSGQGSQYPDMGRGLYDRDAEFRSDLDLCSRELEPHLGCDLRERMFSANASELRETWLTQPALFLLEYALARLLMRRGISPSVLIGHSIGEYVAATLSGVFDRSEALFLVARRGRLMQEAPPGAMIAVPLGEARARELLRPGLSLAAVNADESVVLSGTVEAVERISTDLAADGIDVQRLHTSHAFHSEMMREASSAFEREVAKVSLGEPSVPFLSNVTGERIRSEQARSPAYWAEHLRGTVRFAAGIKELLRDKERIFVEVGPGSTLAGLVRAQRECERDRVVVTTLPHPLAARGAEGDVEHFLDALGRLWCAGARVDLGALGSDSPRFRIALPTYPFERKRFWFEGQSAPNKLPLDRWFYLPSWKRAVPPSRGEGTGAWLLFRDSLGLGDALLARLRADGARVVVVERGDSLRRIGLDQYELRPGEASDYEALLPELRDDLPARTLHLWDDSIESLFALARALGNEAAGRAHDLLVVTRGAQEVSGCSELDPMRASAAGVVRTIARELPGVSCRSVDVPPDWDPRDPRDEELVERLLAEATARSPEPVVAYRGVDRWVESFEPAELPSPVGGVVPDGAVVLVTGGLGGIGLALARKLHEQSRAKLVLTSRSAPAEGPAPEGIPASDVMIQRADAADYERMKEVFARARERFGSVHGVIHAAGVPGSGLLQLKTREMAERVMRPKVQGSLVLERLAREHGCEWLVLCSSLAAVLGAPGQADYCAANAFQDALARKGASSRRPRTIALSWDTWAEAGMAVSAALPEWSREEARRVGMSSDEGYEVLRRAIAAKLPRVLVSTRELGPRLHARPTPAAETEARAPRKAAFHPRPPLQTDYVPPRDETERRLAQAWTSVLGIDPIGVRDNFFELGGDSVSALRFLQRMKNLELDGTEAGAGVHRLRLVTLYEAPTIEALARLLASPAESRSELKTSGARGQSRVEALGRRRRDGSR